MKEWKQQRCTACNERFGASGAVTRLKVCADLEVLRPSERQWKPRLPQAAGTLGASGESDVERVQPRIESTTRQSSEKIGNKLKIN